MAEYKFLEYDDDGNIIGEAPAPSGRSPIADYMGANVDKHWDAEPERATATVRLLDPEASERMPTFRRLRLSDIESLPDPTWLVDELLPEDSFSVVFGAPGSTKSFLALDLACCVATGTPWQGKTVRQGQVMYCVGEGLRGMKWRIESWRLAHPDVDRELLERNLMIVEDVPRLLEKTQAGMLLNTALEMVEEQPEEPLQLFIIDTLARSLVGGDENSAQDVGLAIDACERVRKATGATALVVHHTGVDGSRERGSTALRGAADTSIAVAHDESTRTTTVQVKKVKDAEGGGTFRLSLAKFGHSVVLKEAVLGLTATNGAPSDSYLGVAQKSKAEWAREAMARRESPF